MSEELTLDEQIAKAEQDVAEADDEAERSNRRARNATNALWALMNRRDEAFAKSHTGPMRAPDGRTIRTVAALEEFPAWFGDMNPSYPLRHILGETGAPWITNGYAMIRVDRVGDTPQIKAVLEQAIEPRACHLARRDEPALDKHGAWCRSFGMTHADIRITTLVEDLFPGLEWWGRGDALCQIQATVNGEIVAVIMPIRFKPKDARDGSL